MLDFSFFAETSPRLPFYHFRYSGTSLLSIVANSSNVSYALSAMNAVRLGRLRTYGSAVRVSASYSSVIALIQYYTALWVG